jgi:hypothetical protein
MENPLMRRLALFLMSCCLALPVLAEQKKSFDTLDVHYSVFNSSYLQPDIAAASGLTRSKNQAVINLSVLDSGKPRMATVSGQVKNLMGQQTTLTFRQIKEGEAIYYLAQFPFSSRELFTFDLTVKAGAGAAHSFSFTQEMFPDQ